MVWKWAKMVYTQITRNTQEPSTTMTVGTTVLPSPREAAMVQSIKADSLTLSGTEIVADHRAHPLDNAAGREIEESLQFIVDSQNDHIASGILRQQTV